MPFHPLSKRPKFPNGRMNPSVQAFNSGQGIVSVRSSPAATQPPSRPSSQSAHTPGIPSSMNYPFYPPDQMGVYQQPLEAPHWSYQITPYGQANTGPSIPSVEVFVANMWRNNPSLCASIRQDYNIGILFAPDTINLHGENYLQVAASQIAMQNQATEIANVRNVLSEKEKMLEVGNNVAKDLRTMLVSQQSELKDIKDLIQRGSHSLTASGPTRAVPSSPFAGSNHSTQPLQITMAPVAQTPPAVGTVVEKMYRRSAALSPLQMSSLPQTEDANNEEYGFGHAETLGPDFSFDRRARRLSVVDEKRGRPASPIISTSAIFQPPFPFSTPVVQFGSMGQISPGFDNDAQATSSGGFDATPRTSMDLSNANPGTMRILKEDEVKEAVPPGPENTQAENLNGKPTKTTLAIKPATYAAAVLSAPATPSVTTPSSPAKPKAAPTPDVGFPLQPLPKPTAEQIQSQHQPPVHGSSDFRNEQGPRTSHSANYRGKGRAYRGKGRNYGSKNSGNDGASHIVPPSVDGAVPGFW